jgi:hypothetical protein
MMALRATGISHPAISVVSIKLVCLLTLPPRQSGLVQTECVGPACACWLLRLTWVILPATDGADLPLSDLGYNFGFANRTGVEFGLILRHWRSQYLIPSLGRNMVRGAPEAERTANVFVFG